MTPQVAEEIRAYNKNVYDLIASEFEVTRRMLHWPILVSFIKEIPEGSRVLDIGCGSGRLVQYFKERKIEYVGMDNVAAMLEQARKSYPKAHFQYGDIIDIPSPDSAFDEVLAVAVVHHIPSHRLRLKAMQEVKRVLKPGGQVYMTNWNLWKINFLPLFMRNGSVKIGMATPREVWETKLAWNDVLVPWKRKYLRYYHAFTRRELTRLVADAGMHITVLEKDGGRNANRRSSENWVVVAKK